MSDKKNKFEEFESELGPAIDKILPGSKCGKIVVTFIDDDDTVAEISITRDGFSDRFPGEEE